MKKRQNMISFQVTAIDIILVIAVVVLLILYMTKFLGTTTEQKTVSHSVTQNVKPKPIMPTVQSDFTECPRGFGSIRKLGEDNTVSERCLGCYRIMECYSENE